MGVEVGGITVVGSANIDIIGRVPALPRPGETVLGSTLEYAPGGKGANQAVAAARAGSPVSFVGRVGADAHGDLLTRGLVSAGVDTQRLAIDDDLPTGVALITVDDSGENMIAVLPGANAAVSQREVEGARDVIAGSAVLLLQLEIPLETTAHAARLGREEGALVILNPAPARAVDPPFLRLCDVLVPNAHEVARLSGMGPPSDPAEAAHLLIDAGTRAVVVTLGGSGVVVVTPDEEVSIPAFPVQPVDTTGAGDAFVGNLAHALARGQTLVAAARFAAAAAALSVLRAGAQPSMPLSAETERLLGEYGP